jgi:hypothetical protein
VSVRIVAGVAVVSLFLVSGCSSSSDSSSDSSNTVTYGGVVSELKIGIEAPIDAVKICAVEKPNLCATSDIDGKYSLKLPKNSQLTAVANKAGYVQSMTFITTSDQGDPSYDGSIVSETTGAAAYQLAGFGAPDDTKGTITVDVLDAAGNGVKGATIALKTGQGQGPVYTKGTGTSATFDPTLTATDSGGAAFGLVTPGDITLDVTAPGMTCAPDRYGWASQSGTTDGKADAKTISFFVVKCQ